jgi:hypothetical protein
MKKDDRLYRKQTQLNAPAIRRPNSNAKKKKKRRNKILGMPSCATVLYKSSLVKWNHLAVRESLWRLRFFISASVSPAIQRKQKRSAIHIIDRGKVSRRHATYGMYCMPAFSRFAIVSSGSEPITLIAYVPGTYPSSRCHRATQLWRSSTMEIRPSNTCEVHSWIASLLPRRLRTSSQLGQPSRLNFWIERKKRKCQKKGIDRHRLEVASSQAGLTV